MGHLAEAQFVKDASWFLLAKLLLLIALGSRERGESGCRSSELKGIIETGDQAVPAKQGHEPRKASRRK